jgi:beta-lactamase regulating signal transducer with metallopeptidase domain
MQMAGSAYAAVAAMEAARSLLPSAWSLICQGVAPILVTNLWQSAVVATGLAACLRAARSVSAAHRFLVWAAGFAVMVGLPFASLLLEGTATAAGSADASARMVANHAWLQLDGGWGFAIVLLWGVAAVWRAAQLSLHCARLHNLWKAATPVTTDSEMPVAWASMRRAFSGRAVELCTTRQLENPSVIGFFRPRILIPEWLYERMTATELEQVLLHEAQHMRRGDDWTNLLQKLGLVLFPLNPALFWVERQLCREREMACDEAVVKATGAPRAYATCLTSLAERGRAHRAEALSLGAWQGRSELARRIHSILLHRAELSSSAVISMLVLMTCGLALGTVELSRCPQLVAFTPRLATAEAWQAETTQAQWSRLAYGVGGARDEAGFRAVKAVAVLPEPHAESAIGTKTSVRKVHSTKASVRGLDSTVAADEPEFVRVVASGAETTSVGQQQWIVFTAWEQVSAMGHNPAESTTVSDFDSTEQKEAQGDVKQTPQNRGQGTAVPVIVRILPADFMIHRLELAHVSGGWLVFQL